MYCDLWSYVLWLCQKLGMILEKKGLWKSNSSKNYFNKQCSPKLLLSIEKINQKSSDNFWHRKFTLKVRLWHFLTRLRSYEKHLVMLIIVEDCYVWTICWMKGSQSVSLPTLMTLVASPTYKVTSNC